jgi:hypothetical protein
MNSMALLVNYSVVVNGSWGFFRCGFFSRKGMELEMVLFREGVELKVLEYSSYPRLLTFLDDNDIT